MSASGGNNEPDTKRVLNIRVLQWALTLILVIVCVFPASMFTFRQFQENQVILSDEAAIAVRFLDAAYQQHQGQVQNAVAMFSESAPMIIRPGTNVRVKTPKGLIIYEGGVDAPWPTVTATQNSLLGPVELVTSIQHRLKPISIVITLATLTLSVGLFILHARIFPGWRRAQRSEQEARQRFSDIASVSSDWFWELDADLKLTFNNLASIGRIHAADTLGKRLWELDYIEPVVSWARVQDSMKRREYVILHYAIRSGEHRFWHEIKGKPFFDERGDFAGYRGSGRDITLRKQNEVRLETLAYQDALTGLTNLNGLERSHSDPATGDEPVLVVLLDLSGIRNINSAFGFAYGNDFILAAAHALRQKLGDTVFGLSRINTDKFVFMSHYDESILWPQLKHLQGTTLMVRNYEMKLHFSLGAAHFEQGDDLLSVIQLCELALVEAKRQGRGRFVVGDERLIERSMKNSELLNEVESAIARDELFLVYQPKYDLVTDLPASAEALIRWNRNGTTVMPGVFIPLLEQVNLMEEIDRWVIRAACRQLRDWLDQGLKPLPVSINISARSLETEDLVRYLLGTLSQYRVPEGLLEVELTEYQSIDDIGQAASQLYTLREAGIRIAIDDYGTGYSNLDLISLLPIDHLKIDQGFVRRGFESERGALILDNVVKLGLSLGVQLTAEGVETELQRDTLKAAGCQFVQGYLYSRPLLESDYRGSVLS